MALVVVGGNSRNVGKTSVVADLIRALPEFRWTAFKLTQYGHGVCSANGEPCACETADHAVAFSEERPGATGTDSARYLAAGARRSFWVRTRQGELLEAMPRLRKELALAENAIVESNSLLRFIKPDLFIVVLDATTKDFKESARRYLDRADVVVVTGGVLSANHWNNVSENLLRKAVPFSGAPRAYCSAELIDYVKTRLSAG